MDVVYDEQQSTTRAGRPQCCVDCLEEPQTIWARRRIRFCRHKTAKFRYEGRGHELGNRGRLEEVTERLGKRLVGSQDLLGAAPEEHDAAVGLNATGCLEHQPRLADSRFA